MKSNISKLLQAGKVMADIITAKNYKEYLSFAQAGEDRILRYLFTSMGRKKITYLEIGTNNPVMLNNTYLFYLGGSHGVCIEPNPTLIPAIKKKRPRDICLNIGIAGDAAAAELDFYIFDASDAEKGLSTFSKQDAMHVQNTTQFKIAEVKKIPVMLVTEILEKYFSSQSPDLVSIDVEGLDLEILRSFPFSTWRPAVFCVETVNFTLDHNKIKNTDIIDYMRSQDYFVYADTGINSIFADRSLFHFST